MLLPPRIRTYLRICSTSKMIPFRKHLILSSSISTNFRSIIHGAWRNSRCFTASFTMRVHFTVWADYVRECEIAGFTILITLISIWQEGHNENIFLPIEWRLVPIYCYSLSFYAQTTCLENRDRKKCLGQIFWNEKKGAYEKYPYPIRKRKIPGGMLSMSAQN